MGAVKQGRKESHCKDALSNWLLPKAFGCLILQDSLKAVRNTWGESIWGEKERSRYSSVVDSIGQRFVPWGINCSPLLHFWVAPAPVLNHPSSPMIPRNQDTNPDAESEKPEVWTWGEAHLGYTCWSQNKMSGGEKSGRWSEEDLTSDIRSG